MADNKILRGVYLPKEIWDELRKFKEETGIPMNKQIELALRWFWREERRERIAKMIKEEGESYGESEGWQR